MECERKHYKTSATRHQSIQIGLILGYSCKTVFFMRMHTSCFIKGNVRRWRWHTTLFIYVLEIKVTCNFRVLLSTISPYGISRNRLGEILLISLNSVMKNVFSKFRRESINYISRIFRSSVF